jgi:hypothetical protein
MAALYPTGAVLYPTRVAVLRKGMVLLARSGSGSKKNYSHVLEINTMFKETRFDKNNMCTNTLSKKPLAAAVWAKPHGYIYIYIYIYI